MPELPEVETTTKGLRRTITGLTIRDVWTDLNTKDKRQNDTIANPKYFKKNNEKNDLIDGSISLSIGVYFAGNPVPVT